MDSFSESVLERARQRSKMLKELGGSVVTATLSDKSGSPKSSLISKTKISTVMPGSPKLQHNVLNFQQEHFDMEIKLASKDKCLVQVEIQEQSGEYNSDDSDDDASTERKSADLREESKTRLRRLGKLYTEDEDVEMSSPIRPRTEEQVGVVSGKVGSNMSQSARSKLAALAQNIHQWENESPLPLAHQPATNTKSRNKASNQRTRPAINQKNKLELNDSVVNALECQGYTRESADETTKLLTYKFSSDKIEESEPVVVETAAQASIPKVKACKAFVPASRLIEEEKRTPRGRPSIHQPAKENKDPSALSLNERRAIFERNADGAPLLPKAAFALNCPSGAPLKKGVKDVKAPEEHGARSNNAVTSEDRERGQGGGIVSHRLNALQRSGGRAQGGGSVTISQQQIEEEVREERQRDMDLLLNRFHRPDQVEDDREDLGQAAQKPSLRQNPQSKNNSRTSLHNLSGCSAQVASVLEDVREVRVRRNSQRNSSTTAGAAAPRLYPILSDLETETETDLATEYDDMSDIDDASDAQLDLTYPSVSSTASPCGGDDDDDCSGPTPPKCGKVLFKSPLKQQQQRQHEADSYTPTHVVDGDAVLPLQHTVSFYRKQQQNSVATPTLVHKITRLDQKQQQEALDSILDEEVGDTQRKRQEVEKRIAELRHFISTQEKTVAQASRALTLCNARLEFNGSTEQVEAERLLLLAAHRRQAALYAVGRAQLALDENSADDDDADVRGDLTIGRLTLPLKREYVRALGAAGGNGHHVVALVKCDDAKQQVAATRLVSTTATSAANTIDCVVELGGSQAGGGVAVEAVRGRSTVTVEVYCLQARDQHLPHHVKYHIKQPQTATPSTPSGRRLQLPALLRGGKDSGDTGSGGGDGNRMTRVPVESPGGPNTARTSSFALMGYAIFTVRSLVESSDGSGGRRQFTLSATPQMSPLEGSVEVGGVRCRWAIPPVQRRGFLTMYEDVTGFGAWHRRWFRLDGRDMLLRYWKYPDDEAEREGRAIDLRGFQGGVGVVARDVCARLHTLLLQQGDGGGGGGEGARAARYLLSADTKEERIGWCTDLNRVLTAANATQHT